MEKLGSRQVICVIPIVTNGKMPYNSNTKLIARFIYTPKMPLIAWIISIKCIPPAMAIPIKVRSPLI
jgi:hypothetical protein